MTKERKLAIDMWLWIRERYDEWNDYFWGASDEDGYVDEMKYRFIEVVNEGKIPKWRGLCWLCTYVRNPVPDCPGKIFSCERCPLGTCMTSDSAYQILNTHFYRGDTNVSEEVYRACCTTILDALGYKGE